MKKCECGCGQEIPDLRTDGKPQSYVFGHAWKGKSRKPFTQEHRLKIAAARSKQIITEDHKKKIKRSMAGKNKLNENPMWKGGITNVLGYRLIKAPNHPNHNQHGYVKEHHLVIERKLGRYIKRGEVVHHINGIRNDNRIENLMLFKSNSDHMKWHGFGKNI
jgi:uncharacterized protein (DUF1330 family)